MYTKELMDVEVTKVVWELRLAMQKFAPMHSAAEGYAIILEEVDELWDLVKQAKPHGHARFDAGTYRKMRLEAMQIAAMAIRFMIDIDADKRAAHRGEDDDDAA